MLGAMIGSTIGALSTVMLTTKKGHKLQKAAMHKLHEFEGYVKRLVRGGKKEAAKAVNKIRRSVRRKKTKR